MLVDEELVWRACVLDDEIDVRSAVELVLYVEMECDVGVQCGRRCAVKRGDTCVVGWLCCDTNTV
jgi:hypothetical protein